MKPKITVIVTVLNEELSVLSLMKALQKQTILVDEVIIVDGGSSDTTVEKLTPFQKEFNSLRIETKKGNRSLGRNLAISLAKNELIAITDAGCLPHSNWLEKLHQKYLESQAPVIAGYYDAKPKTNFEAAVVPYVLVMPNRVSPNNFLPATRSMMIEKIVWQKIGGFDEALSDNEDYAFAHQIVKAGYRIEFTAEAKVTWQPRNNLSDFYTMIFRFARGDIRAGILRPKVAFIFARYFFLVTLFSVLINHQQYQLFYILLVLLLISYSAWAVHKNFKCVGNGWYWLPILQYISDLAILLGSVVGAINRVKDQ